MSSGKRQQQSRSGRVRPWPGVPSCRSTDPRAFRVLLPTRGEGLRAATSAGALPGGGQPFGRPDAAGPSRLVDRVVARTRGAVSYTHLRAHETVLDLVCRLLL